MDINMKGGMFSGSMESNFLRNTTGKDGVVKRFKTASKLNNLLTILQNMFY
jgi:hypothetical protein